MSNPVAAPNPTSAAESADSPAAHNPNPSNDFWWHVVFGGLIAVTVITFGLWAVNYIDRSAHYGVLAVTIIFGLFMSFNIGGNDVANSFGTSVGAKTLTMKQALLIAAVFEVGGAVLAGGSVTSTVRSGIVDLKGVNLAPMDFAYIMMAALFGAAVWLLIATRQGWPVSTTHSIIGGIVGAAVTIGIKTGAGGVDMVQWDKIGQIALSWVTSPLLGGLAAFMLYGFIKRHILSYNEKADAQLREYQEKKIEHRRRHKENFNRLTELQQVSYTNALARDAEAFISGNVKPEELESDYYRELYDIETKEQRIAAHKALETFVPFLAAAGAMIITAMIMLKGLKNTSVELDRVSLGVVVCMVGMAVWMAVFILARAIRHETLDRSTFILFSWMQVFTAAAFAFSHGSNDIANAVGPFAAILDVLATGGINSKAAVPPALLLAAGTALVAGLWFIGRRVIATVGTGLTNIHPASGFAAELSAAAVVIIASLLGLPVSSTHILIGAILGIGLVNRAANWRLMKPIALAWVITIPAAAGIGAVSVLALSAIF